MYLVIMKGFQQTPNTGPVRWLVCKTLKNHPINSCRHPAQSVFDFIPRTPGTSRIIFVKCVDIVLACKEGFLRPNLEKDYSKRKNIPCEKVNFDWIARPEKSRCFGGHVTVRSRNCSARCIRINLTPHNAKVGHFD